MKIDSFTALVLAILGGTISDDDADDVGEQLLQDGWDPLDGLTLDEWARWNRNVGLGDAVRERLA